ncbi:MAG: glycosyltransferase family 4 protein [Bryobacteraceae bacterium]|jgi:glycosyltransferase involved in cell wall biosynthesis
MKNLLKRLIGGDRPKVIAVIGVTRADVAAGVSHAQSGGSKLRVWAFCAEEAAEWVEGCDRFVAAAGALRVLRDLRSVWPALIIVSWTGGRGAAALKLIPFWTPPFRIVVCNEAGGFFAGRPGPIARHARRRFRDASRSGARRILDWAGGAGQWLYSLAYRTGQRMRDVVRLLYSLAYRGGERARDVALWLYSLAWRAGERARDVADWIWNATLALLAFLARCTPVPAHFVIERLQRWGQAAELAVGSPRGSSFVEIAVSGRGWPQRKVVAAVRNTDVDFIVFRRQGEEARAEPGIALARETGAFAVARQSAYSGWRRRVVTKHAFRKLQPGEATEAFAPYSSLIAIRRDLLARFGVPFALTYGTALMILYWKAAAAGMRSLVLGHGGAVTQEPAMALEDAELVVRLAVSRRLRGMAPAHPKRLRGNVAFSPSHRRNFRGKPRVLVVSPYLPFPLSHGGAVRMYNLCRAMSDEIDFVLACFREAGEVVRYEELHEVFREVYVVDADEEYADPTVPNQVAGYRNSAMQDLVRRLCLERRVDLVQLEYTQMAEYRDQTGAIPLVLVEHDITFTLYEQLAHISPKPEARAEYLRWLAFEREALQCSNAVWTMSDGDRAKALEFGAPRKSTVVVPNGVDLLRFQAARRQGDGGTVLFVGSFRHLPNLLAFEALRETIMPAVWLDCPNAKLHVIAGPDHERAARLAGKSALLAPDSRIAVDGFVEDVRPAYRECDVVAIPLPLSAGTNIKVMEAMACGRAIVSTPSGCQGLGLRNEMDVLVRDIGPGFADAIVHLLAHEELRERIALRARQTVDLRFGWDSAAREALGSYSALLGRGIKVNGGRRLLTRVALQPDRP